MSEEKAQSKAEGGPGKTLYYLKAFSLHSLEEVRNVKEDVGKDMIVIVRVTPLAEKNLSELSKAVTELYEFATSIGGDIARLGEERIVITPPRVRIWRGFSQDQ
jgi:SepF-like predicted cell division protein (DUF552 family)